MVCVTSRLSDTELGQRNGLWLVYTHAHIYTCNKKSLFEVYVGLKLRDVKFILTTAWATEVLSPAEAKDFSFGLCVQISSETHPASCPMGTGGPFPGVNRGRGVTLTTHPYLVRKSRMRSCIFSPPWRLHGVAGQFYFTRAHRQIV
jgi:hypothetical protein